MAGSFDGNGMMAKGKRRRGQHGDKVEGEGKLIWGETIVIVSFKADRFGGPHGLIEHGTLKRIGGALSPLSAAEWHDDVFLESYGHRRRVELSDINGDKASYMTSSQRKSPDDHAN